MIEKPDIMAEIDRQILRLREQGREPSLIQITEGAWEMFYAQVWRRAHDGVRLPPLDIERHGPELSRYCDIPFSTARLDTPVYVLAKTSAFLTLDESSYIEEEQWEWLRTLLASRR